MPWMLTSLQLHQRKGGHTHNKNRLHHALEGGSSLLLFKVPYLQWLLIFGRQLLSKRFLDIPGQPLQPSAHENLLYPLGKGLKTNRYKRSCHHPQPPVRHFRPKNSVKLPSKQLATVHRRNLMTGDRQVIAAANLVLEPRLHCHVVAPRPLALGIIAWRVEQVANAALTVELQMVTM